MSTSNMKPPVPSASFPELKGFRILLELARSPKGVIYKARRLVEQDVVALKVFRPSLCERKFVQELPANAEASFLLEHKNMVRSLGCVHESGSLLLMTDFAPGDPASKILARERPFSPARALRIALQCANALSYAASHKRFHGRLHPGDIILGEDDARIIGIGLGERPEHAAWSVRDPYLFEPLMYTAPEAMPSHAVARTPEGQMAADVYSLGAILFHMLAGSAPFRERDEEALVSERKSRLVSPVVWPSEVKGKLPLGAPGLVEKMMTTDPAARPAYVDIVAGLSRILENVEKDEAQRSQAIAAAFAAAETATGLRAGIREAVASPIPPAAPQPQVQAPVQPVVQSPRNVETANSKMLARLYTMFLVGMTALAFMVVFGFTAIIFFYSPAKQKPAEVRPAVTVPQDERTAMAVNPQNPPAKKDPSVPVSPPLGTAEPKTDEYATATRQLDYIQEMIAKGDIKHTPALLRLTRSIAERAGRDTSTGVRSMVLAAEIEETLLRQNRNEAPQPADNANPANPNAIPGVGKTGTAPVAEAAKVQTEIPIAIPAENPAKPIANAPADKPAAAQRLGPIDEKIAVALRASMNQAKAFEYKELLDGLEKLSAANDGDARKVIEAFTATARAEQDLFKRCRQRLAEQIQRHPRHDSPLQVFPRKNDPNGDDITDFDEKGLTIATKKGASVTKTNKDWAKIPPLQAFMLLQLLGDRNSADDQCGLAIFAFNRGLKDEAAASLESAKLLEGGKDKVEPLVDLFKIVGNAVESAPKQ